MTLTELDRAALDRGETIECEMTLQELGELLQREAFDSPDGFVPVREFLHHGTRSCVRLSFDNGRTLGCSIDHKLELAMNHGDPTCTRQVLNPDKVTWEAGTRPWSEAQWLSQGDQLRGNCGHAVRVVELEHIGEQEIFDLVIDHAASRGAHRFFADGISVHCWARTRRRACTRSSTP